MSSSQTKVSELLRLMRARIEDPNGLAFPDQEVYDVLDQAQRYVCTVIHNRYLTSLEREIDLFSDNNGKIPLSDISDTDNVEGIFRSEILSVTEQVDNRIRDFKRIENNEYNKLDNEYIIGNEMNTIIIFFADTIYTVPKQSFWLKIRYLKSPSLIFNPTTSIIAEYCDLESVLIDPLLDIAESVLWKTDNKPNRVKLAQQSAVTLINLLNERYAQERKIGLQDVGEI